MVADHLQEDAELHWGQMGSRKGRSAIDAIMWVVGKAQEAIRKPRGGHARQLLCKDVKFAFLSVTLDKVKAAIAYTKAAR